MNKELIKEGVKKILKGVGEDIDRDGLKETPERVADMYEKILNGYEEKPEEHLKLFDDDSNQMVTVTNIPLYSFCEHHMMIMHGKVSMAYISNGKVLGLSKLVRIARSYAKKFQIQERLTKDIADFMENKLSTDCAVVIEMEHTCMSLRGARTPGAMTMTSAMRGKFLNPEGNKNPKEEFLRLIGK